MFIKMADNADFKQNWEMLEASQNAEHDNREMVREADHFLNKRDGQWEPDVISRMSGKPRYTFDQCNPVVDDIMGEMDSMDFSISVKPSGGEADKETAKNRAGIIRNLENLSGARYTYKQAARTMTGQGLGGWRVVQAYRDSRSFQQDLLIDPINNFRDRVWFSAGAEKRTMEDADYCWVLTSMSKYKYDKKFPKGSGMSVGQDVQDEVYTYKPENVVIGECYKKVEKSQELGLLSNGSVVEIDDDFDKIRDELFAKNITVERTKTKKVIIVHHQLFDGGDWLGDDTETVFDLIPVIPIYANFQVSENKVIYWGVIEKLMDPQRVLNYAESRKIADGALKPRPKIWLTRDQAESADVIETLRTANTNMDSHQLYDFVDGQPPPFRPIDSQPDSVLIETAQSAERYINRVAIPDANRGVGLQAQSGAALNSLQNKGDNTNFKYFTAVEIGIAHTCRIINNALPRVYDTRQELNLMAQDGSVSTITIKDRILDEDTGEIVEINDLNKGQYHVTCSSGPAFHNRQQETVAAINELAAINPDIMAMGTDVLLNNINSPGIDVLADRIRRQMVMNGIIPEDQLTDEEKEMLQAQAQQAQGQQPSAMDQALIAEAQARTGEVEAKTYDTLSRIDERDNKFKLELAKLEQKQEENLLKYQNEETKNRQNETKVILQALESQANQLKILADTFKILREGQGLDVMTGPEIIEATINQADLINDAQENIGQSRDVGVSTESYER